MAATLQIAPSTATPAAPSSGIAVWTPDGLNLEWVDDTGTNHIAGAGTVVTEGAVTAGEVAIFADATGNNIAGTTAPSISGANITAKSIPNSALSGPLNGWYDVTKYGVSPTNSATMNSTALAALLAGSGSGAAPAGSTIYFPGGTYSFNALITVGDQFVFQGQGTNYSGGYTILVQTANVGGLFTHTAGQWYSQYRDITFSAAIAQTSGAAVNVNNNVGTNFYRCQFQGQSATATWYDAIDYVGANSANSTIVEDCQLGGFTHYGIYLNSAGASLVAINTVIQGIYGTTSQVAAAGICTIEAGALQLDNCDILGSTNNLLLAPTSGNVVSSVFATNTYFDNASGSCIKITGAGATVRTKFSSCSFTLASTATGFAAVEVSTTYAGGAAGLDFVNCNVLNTFGTSGTSYGFNFISGAADVTLLDCRVAGWTTGIAVTPLSGVTAIQIQSGTVGTCGGYSGNTTGINLGAGAYASILIQGVNLVGNTGAAIVDGSTSVTYQKVIKDNPGAIVAGGLASFTATSQAATTTEAQIIAANIPAYALQVGSTYRITVFGQATVTTANGTTTWTCRIGTASLTGAAVVSIADATSAVGTAIAFSFTVLVTIKSIGATGTAVGFLTQTNNGTTGIATTNGGTAPSGTAPVAATVNTTVANIIEFTVKTSATTTLPTIYLATIEAVR